MADLCSMIKAIRLYTGADGDSHFEEGMIAQLDEDAVVSIHFKETQPHGVLDWHTAPEAQYVLTLSGTLEFTMRDGSTFILNTGDVLLALDTTGTAHKWRMLGDAPWKRAYVVLKNPVPGLFTPSR